MKNVLKMFMEWKWEHFPPNTATWTPKVPVASVRPVLLAAAQRAMQWARDSANAQALSPSRQAAMMSVPPHPKKHESFCTYMSKNPKV